MRKTALNQLLEYKDELIKNGELTTLGIFQEVISRANELLETEKQQIVEAYENGYRASLYDPAQGDKYYDKHFTE